MCKNANDKKSICFITPALVVGGVERVLMDTAPLLTPYYNVTFLSLHGTPDSSVVASLEAAGAKVLAPNLPATTACLLIPYLSKFHYEKVLREVDYDYLICVNNAAMNAGYNKKAKKTVFWNHMDIIQKHADGTSLPAKIKRALFKTLYRRYDCVWTVCDKINNDFVSAFQLSNVQTLPNPIDFKKIKEKSAIACDLQVSKEFINVFSVGRLCHEKGFDRLLRSWKNAISKTPNARLYIIGEGGARTALEEIIATEGLSESVFLLGQKENPFPYLAQADLFVCPSREESFGLVIVEAMALGIPVITTATAGGSYTTHNGTLATCVENTDEALSEGLRAFLETPEKYPFSLEEAKKAAQSYDLPAYQENILRLLKQLED